MKNKDIISLLLVIGILSGETYQYSSPYLADEIRSSPKNLFKFPKKRNIQREINKQSI